MDYFTLAVVVVGYVLCQHFHKGPNLKTKQKITIFSIRQITTPKISQIMAPKRCIKQDNHLSPAAGLNVENPSSPPSPLKKSRILCNHYA